MHHVAKELCFRDLQLRPGVDLLRGMGPVMNPVITSFLSRHIPTYRKGLGWIRLQRMAWRVEHKPPPDVCPIPEVVKQMTGVVSLLVEYTDEVDERVNRLLAGVTTEVCRKVEIRFPYHYAGNMLMDRVGRIFQVGRREGKELLK